MAPTKPPAAVKTANAPKTTVKTTVGPKAVKVATVPRSAKITKLAKVTKRKSNSKPKHGKARNYNLGSGVYRFSRSRMYHKKALWKFVGKQTPKAPKPKRPITIEKPIGGDKNGGKRVVLIHKRRNYYPTQDKVRKHPSKQLFKNHKRTLRSSLTPGTVGILLAGSHKGKRVVVLKQLKSGLLLITGPFLVNACPLRRVNQIYVIGTRTKIDISDVKIPKHINDDYFKRDKKKRAKKEEGDIFSAKKEQYKPSEQRRSDQKLVDKLVINAIKKHSDRKLLFTYLASMFGLRSSQYPHRLQF